MAEETVTHVDSNVVGDEREDYGEFTTTGAANEFRTRLGVVNEVHVIPVEGGQGTRSMELYKNTNTTTEDVAGYGGVVHFANAGVGQKYRYRAVGK